MKILAIGDIVGGIAIEYLSKNLSRFVRENRIDFVIANAENASEIKGLSRKDADSVFSAGVDFITLGNHAFGKKDLYDYLDDKTQPMDIKLFELQLSKYFDLLREKKIEGIIFCSNTVGDAPLETNKILKEYISKYGEEEI